MDLSDILFKVLPILFGLLVYWVLGAEVKEDLEYNKMNYTLKHKIIVVVIATLAGYAVYHGTFNI